MCIVACCLLPVACCLKTFSLTGDFIWPPTVPHLTVNALNVSGAFSAVCLINFDLWPFSVFLAKIKLMPTILSISSKSCNIGIGGVGFILRDIPDARRALRPVFGLPYPPLNPCLQEEGRPAKNQTRLLLPERAWKWNGFPS